MHSDDRRHRSCSRDKGVDIGKNSRRRANADNVERMGVTLG
ncbi:hypothetical protein RRSWK_07083 [Rhodopirellula sp. SWK7]|nr:hypothetical protein RRSWK_07083 [Rhodopirellula sp. SWK7]